MASSGNNAASLDGLLKEYYDDQLEDTLFEDNPIMGIIPKDEKVEGRHFDSVVHYGTGVNGTGSFTNAASLSLLTSELNAQFSTTLKEIHGLATVSNQVLRQTMSDRGAMMEASVEIIDGALAGLARNISVQLYRNGSGSLGRIGSISGSVITLATLGDIYNFSEQMELDLATAETTGSVEAYGTNNHGLYVTAVDYDAGTMTVGLLPQPNATACNVTDGADGIPTAAANDFIFKRGTRNVCLQGMAAWIPSVAPISSDSFNGVNRYTNPSFLAGSRKQANSGQDLSSVLIDAMANVAAKGGKLSHFLMPHNAFASLSKSLQGQTVFQSQVTASVGYPSIRLVGTSGSVVCMPDRNCPATTVMGINRDSWKLISSQKAIDIDRFDGLTWRAQQAASGYEVRFYGVANLVCTRPVNNINITIPSF